MLFSFFIFRITFRIYDQIQQLVQKPSVRVQSIPRLTPTGQTGAFQTKLRSIYMQKLHNHASLFRENTYLIFTIMCFHVFSMIVVYIVCKVVSIMLF